MILSAVLKLRIESIGFHSSFKTAAEYDKIMPQQITRADIHRGWFRCRVCEETLPVFYHRRCPTCHCEFMLLPSGKPGTEREAFCSEIKSETVVEK